MKKFLSIAIAIFLSVGLLPVAYAENLEIPFEVKKWNDFEDRSIRDIAYMNGTYVVVGTGGLVYVSHNFFDWTPVDSGVFETISQIKSNGKIFAATGSNFVITSPDGYNWEIHHFPGYITRDRDTKFSVDVDGKFVIPYQTGDVYDGVSTYYTENFETFERRSTATEEYREAFKKETGQSAWNIMCFDDMELVYSGDGTLFCRKTRDQPWKDLGEGGGEYRPDVSTNPQPVFVFRLHGRMHVFRDYGQYYVSDDLVNFEIVEGRYYNPERYRCVGDYIVSITDRNQLTYTIGDGNWDTWKLFPDCESPTEEETWFRTIGENAFRKVRNGEQEAYEISKDFKTWEPMPVADENSQQYYLNSCKWFGDRYLAQTYEDNSSENGAGRNLIHCYLLDRDFNVIEQTDVYDDSYYVKYYYDGAKYYLKGERFGLLVSKDFVNWEQTDSGEIPIHKEVVDKERILRDAGGTSFSFEQKKIGEEIVWRGLKWRVNGHMLLVSSDGVYYKAFQSPIGGIESHVLFIEDKLVAVNSLYEIRMELQPVFDYFKSFFPPYIILNHNVLGFSVPPEIENDRTLVPLRFLFEKMRAHVDWNGEFQQVTVTKDDRTITFTIDKKEAKINDQIVQMEVPPRLINEKTMVPLRFFAEHMDFDVVWEPNENIIWIDEKRPSAGMNR